MKRRALALTVLVAMLPLPAITANRQGMLEILYGRYTVKDSRFATIYAGSGPIEGLALTASLFLNFEFYLEAKYLSQSGKLTFTQEATKFGMVPFSFGLRYAVPLGILEPFFGAGLDYYVYYEKNDIGTVVDYTRGSHAMAGVRLNFGAESPFALTGRIKYTLAKATRGDVTIDLGGLELAAGLAIVF